MSADDIDLAQLLLIAKESLRNHLTDASLQTLVTRLQELHDQYDVLTKKEAQELRTLREPIFTFGVYLEPGPDDERDLVVGTEGQRIIVRLSEEIEQRRADLKQGQEVVLNNQKNIVSIHDIAVPGELAEVVNVIKPDNAGKVMMIYEEETPPTLVVLWRNDQEIRVRINEAAMQPTRSYLHRGSFVQLDEAAEHAVAVVRPKLHVRTGGGEGTIIEISEQLMLDDVQIGNMVRFEPTYRFAFEKIASNATSKLTLSAPPDTTYEDIGGLDEQIAIIHSAIELPYIYRAQYREYNMARPKGILLYGPPGCGKTMIARAIANSLTTTIREHLEEKRQRLDLFIKLHAAPQDPALLQRYATLAHMPVAQIIATDALARLQEWLAQFDVDVALAKDALLEVNRQLSKELRPFFMNIKGPELLSKWVGETERQIREIFEEARSKSSFETPVVIFFDEMESLFRTRGSGRSSDVETTIVPQFLAEIDGVETTQNVIIIGASNRPDMVDPAFLRPGRFDRKIRVDRPNEEAARDIMAKSLVSTLPLNPRGLSSTHGAVGKVVFRSGYKKYQKTRFLEDLMKISVDLRLLQSLDAEDIRILTPYAELTVAQTRTQVKAHEELANKLQRFRGITGMRDILRVRADFDQLMQDAHWQQFIKTCIRNEWIAEKLILETIRYLYADSSELSVLMVDGRISFKVREFMNGATLDSIVMRAKSAALRRSVDGMAVTNGIIGNDNREEVGITKDDLVRAIREELHENKEQLAQYKVQNELKKTSDSIQTVDVLLEEVIGENPWFEQKLRPYQPEARS